MKSFNELNLSPELSRAITDLGFETPSAIQAQALPILTAEPTDFIGLAATGTGKTAAFAIPLLEKIDPTLKHVQAVVLCPTRELALQVTGQMNLLGKHKRIKALPIYGGAGYGDQIHGLKSGHQIVVGTPGRMVDHIERETLKIKNVKVVVLDEADKMVSMGFKEELDKILAATDRDNSKTWLFSATMERDVRRVADTYLRTPKIVQVNRIGRTARSGKSGIAISLVTPSHRGLITQIERITKSRMKEGRIPSRRDVGLKKVAKMLVPFQTQKNFARATELLSPEWRAAVADLSAEEIVGRFLCILNPETFENQERSKPLQAPVMMDSRGNALPNETRSTSGRPGRDRHKHTPSRGRRDERRGPGRHQHEDRSPSIREAYKARQLPGH